MQSAEVQSTVEAVGECRQVLSESSQLSISSYRLVGVVAMRFWLRCSRFGPAGDKLLEVCRDLSNERLQSARCGAGGEEPTADLALDLVDRQGAVDFPWRTGVPVRVGGDVGGQGIEVVEDGLGAEILIGRMPRQAGSLFEPQAMLEPAKCLFDPPAAMVQGAKRVRRKSDDVKQRSHQHMHAPVRRDHPHQADRGRRRRALLILRIACIRRPQAH
jgi:hypothetical protein